MDDAFQTLADVGERAALARILPLLPSGADTIVGPGDDCAVIAAPDARVVVTTDTMLEGADFRLDWSTWFDLGVKAVGTNLSDVAAMGARPTGLVVALAVPAETTMADLESFARGLADAIAEIAPGCGVVGGDLSTAVPAAIAVTAFGDLGGREPVVRSGARVGDLVVVSGRLGLSGTGLDMLFTQATSRAEAEALRAQHPVEILAQLAPRPNVAAGPLLADAGATAMLDISDALALDASRIATASGVCLDLDQAALEADGVALEHVLYGGEDHALLATLPADAELPDGIRVIGRVVHGEGVRLDGAEIPPRGWDPFQA